MSENVTTLQNTKHVDIYSKFGRQYREDGIVNIVFVCLEENDLDIMTKNVVDALYKNIPVML